MEACTYGYAPNADHTAVMLVSGLSYIFQG